MDLGEGSPRKVDQIEGGRSRKSSDVIIRPLGFSVSSSDSQIEFETDSILSRDEDDQPRFRRKGTSNHFTSPRNVSCTGSDWKLIICIGKRTGPTPPELNQVARNCPG